MSEGAQFIMVADSTYRTWETRESNANYYGRLLSRTEDGAYIPVICGHGGSMWLCAGCAESVYASQTGVKTNDPTPEDLAAIIRRELANGVIAKGSAALDQLVSLTNAAETRVIELQEEVEALERTLNDIRHGDDL